jgi:phospholipid/cholesterol/gamma-HCH transport system substrate-binding protein
MFEREKQMKWSKLRIGVVITFALILLLLAVFFAGNISNLFSRRVELKAQIHDVAGLRRGAPVWIYGREIGYVKNIKLDPVHGNIVTLEIDSNVLSFIKEDSTASVMTMGLLGDKYLEIHVGSPQANPIPPGGVIKGIAQIELKDVMATAATSIEKVGEFVNKLDRLVTEIEQGRGTIAKLVNDPALYDNLNQDAKTFSLLLEDVRNARGTLKRLIEDPSLYERMLNAAASIEEFSKKINDRHGTLQKLVEDPSLYNQTLTAVSELEEFSRKLKEGKGSLEKLITDPQLYENLDKGAEQLRSILGRVEEGRGLLGAFVRDEELTKELKDTILQLKDLLKDIQEHPKKYFKLSLF